MHIDINPMSLWYTLDLSKRKTASLAFVISLSLVCVMSLAATVEKGGQLAHMKGSYNTDPIPSHPILSHRWKTMSIHHHHHHHGRIDGRTEDDKEMERGRLDLVQKGRHKQ